MKPKPIHIITIIIYLLTTGCYAALFADIYKTSNEKHVFPNCENFTYIANTGSSPIYSQPKINVSNPYNSRMHLTYTFSMCLVENKPCATPFSKTISINPNGNYQHTKPLNMNINYRKPGEYHYKVTTDLTGDLNEHEEKICTIHVIKND